jgi:hypothetical protein
MTTQKDRLELRGKVSTIEELSERFYFIEDEVIRSNVALSFQYIIFLIAVVDELHAEHTSISSSIYKDMIVHTGTIIEACLHYSLRKFIDAEIIKSSEVMPKIKKDVLVKLLFELDEGQQIRLIKKQVSNEKLKVTTAFKVINEATKKADIITPELYEKVERVRELRNNIHVTGLSAIDDGYDKEIANEVFDIASEVIQRIETCLTDPLGVSH